MACNVIVSLRVDGQELRVVSAPAHIASGAVQTVEFDVSMSEHWDGFAAYYLVTRCGGEVEAFRIENGVAVVDVNGYGAFDVSVFAEGHGCNLRSNIISIRSQYGGF